MSTCQVKGAKPAQHLHCSYCCAAHHTRWAPLAWQPLHKYHKHMQSQQLPREISNVTQWFDLLYWN